MLTHPKLLSRSALAGVMLMLILGACSRDLSREAALQLISAHEDFIQNTETPVPVGRFVYDWRNVSSAFPLGELTAAGLLTMREGPRQGWWWKEYFVELTPAGAANSAEWRKDTESSVLSAVGIDSQTEAALFWIPIAQRRLIEVTGLKPVDEYQREAEFSWQWVPTKHAGWLPNKVPSQEVSHGTALCQRYDDGWRITYFKLYR